MTTPRTDSPRRRPLPPTPCHDKYSPSPSARQSIATPYQYRHYHRANRSISPPSVRDVPGLSRAETFNSLSSCASSIAPSSSRGTPGSINTTCSSSFNANDEVLVEDSSGSPSHYPAMPSVCAPAYLPPPTTPAASTGMTKTHQPSCETLHQQQPCSKKMRMAGHSSGTSSFMARVLASASYMGGRMGRT